MNKLYKGLLAAAAAMALAGCSSAPANNAPAQQPAQTTETKPESNTQTNTAEANQETPKTDTSAPAEGTANSAQSSNTSSSSANTASVSLSDAYNQLKSAFESKGYTIYDQELELSDAEFKARSNSGVVEVSLEKYASENQARRDFLDETSVDVDESLTPGDACVNDKGSLVVLYNNFNNYCEVEAVDAGSFITYSIDDIEQGSLNTILEIMEAQGFAIR